jgi:phage terminase large subunit GpA-like protein
MSSIPGPYCHDNAPYFYMPMVFYTLPWVREIIVCAGSQLGKSLFMYNTHGYDVHYEPGPSLFIMPTRDTVKDVSLDRIDQMYNDVEPIRRLKSSNPDDIGTIRKKLKNGAITYFAWAGSDAALASKPIKNGKFDEADLIGRRSLNLARARFRTYLYEYKLLEVSKPSTEDGPIWEDLNAAHVIYDYYVPCPHCGHQQTMNFAGYHWTEGVTDPKKIEMSRDAWYECEACAGRWDEQQRNDAVKAAMLTGWQPRHFCAVCPDQQLRNGVCNRCGGVEAAPLLPFPEKIGIHLPAFYSPYVRHSDIVADYLRYQQDPHAKEGNAPSNAEKFWCDDCALPMPTAGEGEALDEQLLYDRREEYAPPGAEWSIPLAACLLTAFVDVQDNRLEILVEAWGLKNENFGIIHETITGNPAHDETWTELEEWFERVFIHENGIGLRITAMGIDTGGHHTDQVYKFVKKWKRRRKVYATKGWHIPGKPIKGKPSMNNAYKVPLYMIGTENAKETVYEWLSAENPGPYYQHFPRSFGFEFFRQLCAEEAIWTKDSKGRSVKVFRTRKGYQRNEGLDLKVGNLAVYKILNPVIEKLHRDLRAQAAELGASPVAAEETVEEETTEPTEPQQTVIPMARKKKKPVIKRRTGFASKLKG